MGIPLHQAKAELFRTMGHPVRVRVLELLQSARAPSTSCSTRSTSSRPTSPSSWRSCAARASSPRREGSTVRYTLATSDVSDVMSAARRILTELLADREDLLTELRAAEPV